MAVYVRKLTPPSGPQEFAYVLPTSVPLNDSLAEVRLDIATLHHGDRMEVLDRTTRWARVRSADGKTGWVEQAHLVDAPSYEEGRRLLEEMGHGQAQAAGHAPNRANLRVQPARDAVQITQLTASEKVEIFDRRVVERPAQPGAAEGDEVAREAWYLVRSGEKGGWVLGRLISLDIPEEIGHYAQGFNMVAWLVLSKVDDNGRSVPQYLAADRIDTLDFDFTRIRVFTWGVERQRYATAYVESNLKGFFPICVEQANGEPHFRLRLEDRKGRKTQRVYRLQNTIVRHLGIVEGWESDAMPEPRPSTRRRKG